jgi:hypothetical protein
MKDRLREALLAYDLWVGGNLATQQDMCALFWARGAERYLVPGGRLAFVLPYAVLNAPVYAGLRGGRMDQVRVRLIGGWALERVWPIFGAQSGSSTTSTCVLFGRREMAGAHPLEVDRWEGSPAASGRQRCRGNACADPHPGALAESSDVGGSIALQGSVSGWCDDLSSTFVYGGARAGRQAGGTTRCAADAGANRSAR